MAQTKLLAQEIAVYKRKLPEWEGRDGKYVLIKGEDYHEFFSSYEDALKHGYEKFGLEPFLVKQVSTIESIHSISRLFHGRVRLTV